MGQSLTGRAAVGDRGAIGRSTSDLSRITTVAASLTCVIALAGCGPETASPAMLGDARATPASYRTGDVLAGSPAPSNDPVRTPAGAAREDAIAATLARDFEQIAGGMRPTNGAASTGREPSPAASRMTPDPASLAASRTETPSAAPSRPPAGSRAASTPAPTTRRTAAVTPAPAPKWNQPAGGFGAGASRADESRPSGAASRAGDWEFDPPPLETRSERRARIEAVAAAAAAAAIDDRPLTDEQIDALNSVLPPERRLDRTTTGSPSAPAGSLAGSLARPDATLTPATDPSTDADDGPMDPALPPDPVSVARADYLLSLLVDAIDHPARSLENAIASALTTFGDTDATLDASLFRSVPDADRDLVEAFLEFSKAITPAITTSAEADADAGRVEPDREAMLAAIDRLRAQVAQTPSLAIQRAALCTSVDGFGVFEALASPHRFLAGDPNAFIVYLEVDDFHSEQRGDNAWVTELQQRVQIYNDRDARPVWATDWKDVVDTNANRRRDFFTAQIIELPGTFSLGVFHLKVQVRDVLTGAETEISIEFEMVAGGSGLRVR